MFFVTRHLNKRVALLERENARLRGVALVARGEADRMRAQSITNARERNAAQRDLDLARFGNGRLFELVRDITDNLVVHRADNVRLRRMIKALTPHAEAEIAPEGAAVTGIDFERAWFVTSPKEGETYADYCARVWPDGNDPAKPLPEKRKRWGETWQGEALPPCKRVSGCSDPSFCAGAASCRSVDPIQWHKARTAPASDGVTA